MKDLRGSHVSAVRSAIYRTFGIKTTTTIGGNRRKNSRDVIGWKETKEVAASYKRLFSDDTMIEDITSSAFPSLENASEEEFNDMCIYTAAVCDIILNLDNPTMEVLMKPLELRMRRFKVFIEFTFFIFLKLIKN